MRVAMKKEKIRYAELGRINETQISVKLKNPESKEAFDSLVDKEFPVLRTLPGTTEDEGLVVRLELPGQEVKYVEDMAASMLASTLGIRFDPETGYDERKEIYRMSGKIVRTRAMVQTATGGDRGLWTTVVSAVVFVP